MRSFNYCLTPVRTHGAPPVSFLNELLDIATTLPDEIFAPNASQGNHDIYNLVAPMLGPWTSLLHRKAAMLEVLRVDGAFESDWHWNEGADTTAGPETPAETETGLWQASFNSVTFDPSLAACVNRHCGGVSAQLFIPAMKSDHAFAVEYVARLFRFNTRWSGPSNRGWIQACVNRDSVNELQSFLAVA